MDGTGAQAAQEARFLDAGTAIPTEAPAAMELPDWAAMGQRIVRLASLLTAMNGARASMAGRANDRPEVSA